MVVQLTRVRRLAAAALAAVACTAGVAVADAPTPPGDVKLLFADPVFVLSIPAGGGAWTLWSGEVQGVAWLAVSAPRAEKVGGSQCRRSSRPLTVCMWGSFGRAGVVTGRVTTRVASVAVFDGKGRRLRSARRGNAYLAVAAVGPSRYTIVARDRHGDVVGRVVRYDGAP